LSGHALMAGTRRVQQRQGASQERLEVYIIFMGYPLHPRATDVPEIMER
jgi:hypothetical protein